MKLLAVHRPDQPASDDFCHGVEGEIAVPITIVCDNGDCGCDRALVGLNSGLASTTVKVIEFDIDHNDAALAVMGLLESGGYAAEIPTLLQFRNAADKLVAVTENVANRYDIGTVLRAHYDHHTDQWSFTEASGLS